MLYSPLVSELTSEIESALKTADILVFAKTGKYLSTLQTAIFRGAWQGQKYEEIAEALYISEAHIKMVGADLWKLLSIGLEEQVTKKTFRATLERRDRLSLHTTSNAPSLSCLSPQRSLLLRETPEEQAHRYFYVENSEVEQLCHKTIERPGALIQINAPHQTGKASLITRILHHATLQGYQTIVLNLQLVDRKNCQSSKQFLQWFCVNVSRALQLPHQLDHYWDDRLGSKMSCYHYFKNYLLQQSDQPIVIVLDEIDWLFEYAEIAEDIFVLLRAWHEAAQSQPEWAKLRLVLVQCGESGSRQLHHACFSNLS